MTLRIIKIEFFLLLTLLVNGVALGQECNDKMSVVTPNERFEDNGDGTVMDKNTRLVWKKCSEGQVYNDQSNNCEGEAKLFVPNEALAFEENINTNGFSGQTDWRVPNIKELSSIVEPSCVNPAINMFIFRNTPSDQFWSSTPSGSRYFCVNFGNGEVNRDCIINAGGNGGMGSMGGVLAPEAYLRFVRN
jgi:hypothetical protein